MTATAATPTGWAAECERMRCPACAAALQPAVEGGLACTGCRRSYPVHDGLLDMLVALEGNNRVAADFYNGPLWPRFRFWEWLTFLCNGGERRARRQILRHLPRLSGTRLLEVAIGDGANLPLIPEDCRVYGNDVSAVQLAACRRHFGRRDLRLLLGEAEALPFCDAAFDNVLSVGAFNYFNDPVKSLREMARVARPGGLVVVADEVPDLPNRLFGHRIGLPQLDRWILSRCMHLGPEFTDMVDRHRNLKLEPIVCAALDDWHIHSLWFGVGYCIVGRPRA
jgi:SAM-dependent methyltransferase